MLRSLPDFTLLVLVAIATRCTAATLHGIVVDSTSGEGIPSATVRLTRGEETFGEVLTGSRGEFAFESVAAARAYLIAAKKTGYVDVSPETSTIGSIVDANDQRAITLKLTEACVVTGRVFDNLGLPARDRKVVALARRARNGGIRLVEQGQPAFTDDRGVYRLYGLAPGHYTLAALPQSKPAASDSFGVVYLPGVVEHTRAEFLALEPGEIRDGLDFSLPQVSRSRIAGVVTGIPADWQAHQTAVSLLGDNGWPLGTVSPDAEGHFTFNSVPLGSYQVVAEGPIIGSDENGPLARPDGRYGAINVVLGEGVLSDLQIQLRDLAFVRGQVAFETAGETKDCYIGSRLSLWPVDRPARRLGLATALAQSGFVISDVPAEHFRMEISGLRDGCYLKEVRAADHKLEGGLVTADGNIHLQLILGATGATVSGKVLNQDGTAPVRGGMVLLVPAVDSPGPGQSVRAAPIDDGGQFRVSEIAPGPYQIVGVTKLDSNDYLDPLLWNQGRTLHVSLQSAHSTTVELRIAR